MRKKGKVLIMGVVFFTAAIGVQAQPGCPNINAGPDQTLNCVTTCATLNASVLQTGESTSYNVSSIPYAPPYPYNGGTQIMANIDDTWSSAISLPFNFCFFGNVYNQIVVGSNGLITFDASVAGGYCSWSYSVTCPSSSLHKNAIFGPYHDIDPSVSGGLYYGIQGVAPCRTFVISYYNVAMFSSSCNSLKATHQIVLYENTNVIEVYILNKPTCSSWNSGNAVVGIQNSTGTVGYTAPGRNTSVWTAANEAWRFTPNGAPNYSVAWFEGATQIDTGLSISVCPTITTTYTGKVTYTNCDAAQVVVQDEVTVNRVNDLSLSVSPTTPSFCAGNNTNITASGATSYSWYPSTGLSGTSGNIVNASPTSTTTYNVIGTYGECIDTVSTTISVTPGPVVAIANPDSAICGGSYATLTASGATTYSWSPSATLSSSSGSSVNATPVGTVTYTVTGTTSGCSGTASATVSIHPNPTVSISSNTPICENTSLSLYSGGGTSYSWSGPNGFVSTTQNPTITGATIAASGNYFVTVTGAGGCTSTAQTSVVVNPNPSPSAGNGGSVCSGSALNLTSGGGTGYSWSGPDGFANSTQNPIITGAATSATGTYTVTVTGTGSCTSTAQTAAVVNPNPTPIISSNSPICENTSLNLTSGGGTGYSWSGPNGFTSMAQAPSITGAATSASGTYTVTVTGTGNCTSTAQTAVVVNLKPTIQISPLAAQICMGSNTVLTASGANTYTWTPTTNISPVTGGTATVSPTTTTTYTAHGTTSGCTDSAQVIITVLSNPVVSVTPSTISVCSGEQASLSASGATTYIWSPSNTLSLATGSDVVATPIATTTYTVTGTTSGCTGTATATVTIKPLPQLSVTPVTPVICIHNSQTLTATGADTYSWSPDSTLSANSGCSVIADPLSNCTYQLTGTLNGCKDSIQIPFAVNPLPIITIHANPPSGCQPFTTALSATSTPVAQSYSWTVNNGFNSTDPSPTLLFLNSGQYDVSLEITDMNGCVNNITEADFITVNPKPTVTFSFTPEVGYVSKPVTFTSSIVAPNSQYIWNFGDGQTATSQSEAIDHYYGMTGLVSITHIYINEFGCSDTATLPLNVIVDIVVPNVFTPNNDGSNDTFVIDGLQYVDGAVMKIYNRWGRKIYHSDNYKNDWNGGDSADGVYFYILTLPDNLKVGPFNGSVTLMR